MKCVDCPARRDMEEEPVNGLCKVGVNQATIERIGKSGCQYNAEQVNRWLKKIAPRTVKSVLMERWAKDTEAMASRMIGYDESESKFFTTNIDGEITNRYEHVRLALEAQIAYLNSAAEVGTDRCSTCENNGKSICSSCIMTGHGNDIDFYRSAGEGAE